MVVENEKAGVESLRREILSYRFEVDRLIADYMRLRMSHDKVRDDARGVFAHEQQLIERLRNSRSWRYTKWLRKLMALLRKDRNFKEEEMFCANRPAHTVGDNSFLARESFPRLPSLPQIGYEQELPVAEKTWDTAGFLSFCYYDQLQTILDRPENRGKPVFIQMVTIDWFVPLYQRPQHMALAMAQLGFVVFYMTGNGQFDKAIGFHEVAPSVFITNQPVPLMLDNALVSFYSTSPVMEYWLDKHGPIFRKHGHVVAYEYIDHIDPEISFEFTATLARQFKRLNSDEVQLGVASAKALIDELHEKIPSIPIAYVPNGVDLAHYHSTLRNDQRGTLPVEMRGAVERGRPIVGYFGALAPWLWYDVIDEVTLRRPDLTFVFIGPDYLGGSSLLTERENVFKLGAIDYTLLPYYAQHFDVGLIPFKPGDIAKTTSPLKLFEYFALSLPVVVTEGMDECTVYDGVLRATSAQGYSEAIDAALRLRSRESHQQSCAALAEANTWLHRAEVLASVAKPLMANRISKTT